MAQNELLFFSLPHFCERFRCIGESLSKKTETPWSYYITPYKSPAMPNAFPGFTKGMNVLRVLKKWSSFGDIEIPIDDCMIPQSFVL
jgi:hypothetical protein